MKPTTIAILLATSLALGGCAYFKKVEAGGPVHPTDEQIDSASPGEKSEDAPYTPWWVELGF